MEQKSKKNIEPLPEEHDDFWQVGRYRADNRTFKPRKMPVCKRGGHTFVQTSGTEVICRACNIGYILTPGAVIKGGQIFYQGNFVI